MSAITRQCKRSIRYPCDICGDNFPSNVVFMHGNMVTCYCKRHYVQQKIDWPESVKRANGQQKLIEAMNAWFNNIPQ